MKKHFCALGLLSLALVGCTPNQTGENSSSQSTSTTGQEMKAPENLPPIAEPYEIEGSWTWTVKQDGKISNLGFFEFKEDANKKITGISKVLVVGLKPIPGRGGDDRAAAAILSFPLVGDHQSPEKITFKVTGNDGIITESEANISSDGYYLNGKSSQLDKEGAKTEYTWIAMRNVNEAAKAAK
ncbi:MAG: hypothetical protein SFT81_05560 [Candidatus Caenarcaniphilales bacterium]|nr:hypothetical protein [Candidatus Caenarcaniphilales bacterium]